MLRTSLVILSLLGAAGTVAYAEESTGQKMDDAKREVQKAGHKTKEAMCAKGDAACMAQKAKDRGKEAVQYGKDKTKDN